MSKNRVRGYLTLAVIFMVFSIITFVVPFSKTIVFWIAYIFAVIAILYQIYIFKISFFGTEKVKSKLYGFPIARIGVIYLVIQLIISLFEMAFAVLLPTWVVIVINVIFVAMAIIGCIATDAMRDEIVRQDIQLKKNVSNMRALQSMSATIVGQCSNADLKKIVQSMADEFKYSDPVSSDQTKDIETELQNQMNEIQKAIIDGDDDSVKVLCNKIVGSLAERNRICALNK